MNDEILSKEYEEEYRRLLQEYNKYFPQCNCGSSFHDSSDQYAYEKIQEHPKYNIWIEARNRLAEEFEKEYQKYKNPNLFNENDTPEEILAKEFGDRIRVDKDLKVMKALRLSMENG